MIKQEIEKLYFEERLNQTQTAKELGMTRLKLRGIMYKLGLKPRTTKETSKGNTNRRGLRGEFQKYKDYRRVFKNGEWIIEHRYVWELYNCKIPKGHVIHHMDQNPINNHISNLKLMNRAEHCKLHHAIRRGGD